MITQYEVPSILRGSMPQTNVDFYPASITADIFKSVQYFTNYTREAVQKHELTVAKKCFQLADRLYRNGDNIVKRSIENIFIFSFTSFLPNDRVERLIVKSMIPTSLFALYLQQVTSSNC